jgi:hypothetical protein
MIAQVLHVVATEPAIAVDPTHPGNANARSNGQFRGCALYHLADDLMTGDDARLNGRKIAFDDVEIGAADATRDDLEQYVSGLPLRLREILNRNPIPGGTQSGIEHGCSHRKSSEDKLTSWEALTVGLSFGARPWARVFFNLIKRLAAH